MRDRECENIRTKYNIQQQEERGLMMVKVVVIIFCKRWDDCWPRLVSACDL